MVDAPSGMKVKLVDNPGCVHFSQEADTWRGLHDAVREYAEFCQNSSFTDGWFIRVGMQ